MERIHWTKVWKKLEEIEKSGKEVSFSLSFVKKSTGEIVDVPSCKLTSFHTKGSTFNILRPEDSEPRKIRKCLILMFNGKSVYL